MHGIKETAFSNSGKRELNIQFTRMEFEKKRLIFSIKWPHMHTSQPAIKPNWIFASVFHWTSQFRVVIYCAFSSILTWINSTQIVHRYPLEPEPIKLNESTVRDAFDRWQIRTKNDEINIHPVHKHADCFTLQIPCRRGLHNKKGTAQVFVNVVLWCEHKRVKKTDPLIQSHCSSQW